METDFVMDSSKISFAEVAMLLTHCLSVRDKPALNQLLQGLRHMTEEAKDQNQTLEKRREGEIIN